jgi:PKHD-type hydroxylase
MILENYYWYFQKAIPEHICDDIVKYGNSFNDEKAHVGAHDGTLKINKKTVKNIRDSNVSFLSDRWLYNEIQPFIRRANELANWNFEWDYSEPCQFTKYKLNQFYEWHADSFVQPFKEPECKNINLIGKIRKLSLTCSLSHPEEYEGGKLQFKINSEKDERIITCDEILPKGSLVVFPSFVVHRVTTVTKGKRYSLVAWNCGYPFK